eukprot:CAMPEP_0183815482 /NCGR_PEP_ID=MMETSP0803_2-20130417/56997_1 /TAXON_ID=195967 /ORGANISM="Crustomastix stigmata, Strain CCMP3273" /LENGTH=367 /DNA_ID=CAMNT_0026060347 /DNA_START=1 /DNA_END=1104 /DNA_ORIENTATION=+
MGAFSSTYAREKYDKKDRYADKYISSLPADCAKGKSVAVTGATAGGLGLHLAMTAAQLGASRVVLINRPSGRTAPAEASVREACSGGGCEVRTVECDLTSLASVAAACEALSAACGGELDVLCLNAGTMASPDEVTADGYNTEAQVNVIAQAALLRGAMPLLEAAAAKRGEARVVQVSSGARNMSKAPLYAEFFSKTTAGGLPHGMAGDTKAGMFGGAPAWVRYRQTKLANAVLTMALHERLQACGSKVKAMVCNPGLAASELQVKSTSWGNMKGWEANAVFSLAGQSVRDGSTTLTACCLAPGSESGDFYEPEHFGNCYGPPVAVATKGKFKSSKDPAVSTPEQKDMLWETLGKAVGGLLDLRPGK